MSSNAGEDSRKPLTKSGTPKRRRSSADEAAMAETALISFIAAVESAGGVVRTAEGFAPAIKSTWETLGEAYLLACRAMGQRFKIARH